MTYVWKEWYQNDTAGYILRVSPVGVEAIATFTSLVRLLQKARLEEEVPMFCTFVTLALSYANQLLGAYAMRDHTWMEWRAPSQEYIQEKQREEEIVQAELSNLPALYGRYLQSVPRVEHPVARRRLEASLFMCKKLQLTLDSVWLARIIEALEAISGDPEEEEVTETPSKNPGTNQLQIDMRADPRRMAQSNSGELVLKKMAKGAGCQHHD